MATLQTRGFTTSGLTGRHTPVDPRFAVADPTAMFRGIQGGMGMIRDIENDALLRQDRPRQQLLRDIELAQAQAELESAPGQKRLKDLQLAEAERRFRIGMLEPTEKPFKALDAEGNLVEYQERGDINPATGAPYGLLEKPTMDVSLIKTARQMESENTVNEARARQMAASGEASLIRANQPASAYAPKPGQTVPYAPLGRNVIWSATPEKIIDAQSGLPVFISNENYATGTKELVKNPAVWGEADVDDDVARGVFQTGTPGATTVNPAPAKITGTQAPANAVPGIDTPFNLNIPKGSFATIQEANAAVANGSLQVQPGDIVLINGVPMKWKQ